jgi:hypothetical protein
MATPKKTKVAAWQRPFLDSLREFPNVKEACRKADVTRQTAYKAKRRDANFHLAWQSALREGFDALEAEVIRRAISGFQRRKSIYKDGKLVQEEVSEQASDTLAIFLLKAHKPRRYREGQSYQPEEDEPLENEEELAGYPEPSFPAKPFDPIL